MEKMKLCLKCGSQPHEPYASIARIDSETYEEHDEGAWTVDCGSDECGFFVGFFQTKNEAIEAWKNADQETLDQYEKDRLKSQEILDRLQKKWK